MNINDKLCEIEPDTKIASLKEKIMSQHAGKLGASILVDTHANHVMIFQRVMKQTLFHERNIFHSQLDFDNICCILGTA